MPLLIIAAGIFLSFSRGAWGLFVASAILLSGALFLRAPAESSACGSSSWASRQ